MSSPNRQPTGGVGRLASVGFAAMGAPSLSVAAEPGDDMTRRILDAGLHQFETFGLRRATMLDVARQAQLSRKTVYRRFANKDALVEAVLLREVGRVLTEIERATADLATIEDQLVEGFVVALRAARGHALLNRVLSTEPDALPYLTSHAGPALAVIHSLLAGGIRRALADGDETALDADAVAEGLLRFVHSFMLTRRISAPLADDRQVRAFARRCLSAMSAFSTFSAGHAAGAVDSASARLAAD